MRISKSLLLFGALLSVAVGSADCVSGQTVEMSFADASSLPFESDRANQTQSNYYATTDSAIYVARNQPTTSTTWHSGSYASPEFLQASYSPAPALVTLGVNDDLNSIISNSTGVVLVDFYADWCGPCQRQSGILHDMEHSASQNQATIIKINIDQHRQLANSLNVSSLPTLMLIKNGQIVEQQSGVADHQRIASMLAR